VPHHPSGTFLPPSPPRMCAAISRGRVPQLTANGKYMVCAGRSNHVAILDTATLEA
jgi:hypothetical protein